MSATETRTCVRCADPIDAGFYGSRRYCSQRCRQRAHEDRVRNTRIDREEAMRSAPYDVTDCDGCHLVERIPRGELVPDGWRRSLNGELRCPRCYERHILTICFRNQYPMPS